MAQLSARHLMADEAIAATSRPAHPDLYRPDRPRHIDHHIDFFGDGQARAGEDADCCGDVFLESLA